MTTHWSFWLGFNVFVLMFLALDLFILHRKDEAISMKKALIWTGFVVSLALMFNLGIYYFEGKRAATEFLAAYLVEQSLSMDNVFVFVMIFKMFKVPAQLQYRVLFYGVLGAIVLRAIFIFAGVALITHFTWITYVFGAFLLFSAWKMILSHEESELNPCENIVVRWSRKLMRVTSEYHGSHFVLHQQGRWSVTPLFIVLIAIESADLIFAVDSIPAVLAITQDTFIVYTSNIFAILALRSLYFALAGLVERFHLLHYGLAIILAFVGVKLILAHHWKISTGISLGIIASALSISVILSFLIKPKRLINGQGISEPKDLAS
jgi:tellurite resistance protein TerC